MCCYCFVVVLGGGRIEWGELVGEMQMTPSGRGRVVKRKEPFPSSFQKHLITNFSDLLHVSFLVLPKPSNISVFCFVCHMLLVVYLLYYIVSLDGDDFMGVSMDLVFPLGSATMAPRAVCLTINITIDDILETDESFTVILTPRRSDVIVSPNATEIRILYDDGT